MARLARDVLSIPASGAGVERLFNSARDTCHYRREVTSLPEIQYRVSGRVRKRSRLLDGYEM